MNKQKGISLVIALAMIGGTAGVLAHLKTNQRLGAPGVRTQPIEGSRNVKVILPGQVLDYTSEELKPDAIVTNTLPQDTSYGQRRYRAPDGSWIQTTVVLMGTDRTSIHKPQYCLQGAGWQIDDAATKEITVPVGRPQPYELPVIKMLSTRQITDANGQAVTVRGLYVYWFVADDVLSGDMSGVERMWWTARDLLRTGLMQRWAYVSCFAICLPGQEEAAFERVKKFIAAAVPEFQLTPKKAKATAAATPP